MNKKLPIELAIGVIALLALILGVSFLLQNREINISNDLEIKINHNIKKIDNDNCSSDEDCMVKNAYNCCGVYPKCLNRNSEIESKENVDKKCKELGISSICGYSEIKSCKCENSKCIANNEIGIANPASVYCQENGGTLEIRTGEDGGQSGFCKFDDGSECEEWSFMRGECKK